MKLWQFLSLVGFLLLVGVGVTFAASQAQPNVRNFSDAFTRNVSRACDFPIGGWTIINCSNVASATSAQLNDWSAYVMQCGVNSYVSWGDEAADTADANDGYLPAGSWVEFSTDSISRYVSCLNIGADSDCRYIECK